MRGRELQGVGTSKGLPGRRWNLNQVLKDASALKKMKGTRTFKYKVLTCDDLEVQVSMLCLWEGEGTQLETRGVLFTKGDRRRVQLMWQLGVAARRAVLRPPCLAGKSTVIND